MDSEDKDLSSLIAARILDIPLTEEENARLDEWLNQSEAHRRLFSRIRDRELARRILRLQHEGYGERMATLFERRVFRRPRQLRWLRWGSVAALFVLVCSLTFYLWNREAPSQIYPGEGGAMLTLADGRQYDITMQSREEIAGLMASVSAVDVQADSVAYHTLTVRAGQEFVFRLPDSTQVWLNSESELRFPVQFAGTGERKVYLKGEAFFDVEKDPQHPFVVGLDEAALIVYGTRFNVSRYADEPLSAVLVEGSIGFRAPGVEEVRLHPSEQLTYCAATQEVDVRRVDVGLHVAWVDHQFVFQGQTLEEIMTTLSRWYDFTPVFTSDDMRHIRLSGRLYRYDDIRILLDSYERTVGLKFKLQGKRIIISE